MKKFMKLVRIENKKEMKKISTKIFILVSLLVIILAVGFVMLMKFATNFTTQDAQEYWKEYARSEIDTSRAELARVKETEDIETRRYLEAQIKVYQYAIDNDINFMYEFSDSWKASIIYRLVEEEATLNMYKELQDNQKVNEQTEKVNNLYKLIQQDDFNGYLQMQKNELKERLNKKEINQEEYDESLEIINLKEKYEIGKNQDSEEAWKVEVLNEIQNIKQQLRTNFSDYTKKLLTYKQRQEMEDTLKIDLYRLENNMAPITQNMGATNYRNYFDMIAESFAMSVVSILIILIAGGAISTEYSKGTIKFLVMTPYKRWKILLAKLVNAVIIMLVLTIILALVTLLIGKLFFSADATNPYLYVQNGEVHSLNHTAYIILRFLAGDIDIFVYLLFALMLSVITRNTAVSVGVSIATYLGSGIAMNILNLLVKADWVKFIPFNNMGLVDKIFTNTTTLLTSEISQMLNNVSVIFSLVVLAVCAVLMLVTMFDSFNKRDIK